MPHKKKVVKTQMLPVKMLELQKQTAVKEQILSVILRKQIAVKEQIHQQIL